MAGRRAERPRFVSSLGIPAVQDQATQRAFDAVGAAVQRLQAERDRDAVTTDLVIGTNRVRHGLARPAVGFTVTRTAVSAAYADAINLENPHPELEVWIDVIGADQPGARVEVW